MYATCKELKTTEFIVTQMFSFHLTTTVVRKEGVRFTRRVGSSRWREENATLITWPENGTAQAGQRLMVYLWAFCRTTSHEWADGGCTRLWQGWVWAHISICRRHSSQHVASTSTMGNNVNLVQVLNQKWKGCSVFSCMVSFIVFLSSFIRVTWVIL